MRLLSRRLALGAAVVVGAAALAATVSDPNDVSGKLDLRSVTATRSGGLITVTVRTWDSWTNSVVGQASANRLFVLFDPDLDGTTEYKGRILYSGGALILLVTGQGQAYEPVAVTRLSGTKVSFTFPVDVLVSVDDDLQVAASSRYLGVKDRAPDSGWLLVPAP